MRLVLTALIAGLTVVVLEQLGADVSVTTGVLIGVLVALVAALADTG
jgi:hypothetical protein